jgi:hypothetical protein
LFFIISLSWTVVLFTAWMIHGWGFKVRSKKSSFEWEKNPLPVVPFQSLVMMNEQQLTDVERGRGSVMSLD